MSRGVDPEVSALTQQVRSLVNQAYRLSQDIDAAIEDLDQYVAVTRPDVTRAAERDDR